MSTAIPMPTVECTHPECDQTGYHGHFRYGDYCSSRCEIRHDGRQCLAPLKYDHCICFTCFRRLKDVEPPKPDFEFTERGHGWTLNEDGEPTLEFYSQEIARQAACGFQDLTGDAMKGEKNRGDRVITGTICRRCGATDHTDHDPTLADRAAIGRLVTLLLDDDDIAVDPELLHRCYADTDDLEFAVGRAVDDESR